MLDINTKLRSYKKTVVSYLIWSAITILIDNIYGIFGHDVSSEAMTWMFLYPLLGGALFYVMIGLLVPKANEMIGYRTFYNLYNSGIATLTVGSFLKGILEIAGATSRYIMIFYFVGLLFILVGLVLLCSKFISAVKELKNN